MITNLLPGDVRILSKTHQTLDIKEYYWGLICFSREPYAAIDHDFEDEVTYGVFARGGGCLAELSMTWEKCAERKEGALVHLSAYSDALLLLDTPMHKRIINRLLLEEMSKLRGCLYSGQSLSDSDAPYAALEKCELEYAAVRLAVESMKHPAGSTGQMPAAQGTPQPAYILHSDFRAEDVRTVPFTIAERLANFRANQAEGFSAETNYVSGIVCVGLDEIVFAYDPDPFASFLDVLEHKLIGGAMDSTSYRLVGTSGDGNGILAFVMGIDYDIAEQEEVKE